MQRFVVVGAAAWTSFRNAEVFTPLGASPLPERRYLVDRAFLLTDAPRPQP
jgi:hypothetical protein